MLLLLPLPKKQGKRVHEIISAGDMIADGVRYRSLRAWQVGLIFSVDILDLYPFEITDMSTVESRRMAVGTGKGNIALSSSEGPTDFGVKLKEIIAGHPHPDSVEASRYFEFHFSKGVALEDLALLTPDISWTDFARRLGV